MTLIDYFNAFHVRSQELALSANTRSLYLAILAEFNKLQYPPQLKLQNTYLQHLSGINSTSSFRSALTALINTGLISKKKQFYSLKDFRNNVETFEKEFNNTSETLSKDYRKTSEIVQKDSFSSTSIPKNRKEKEKEIEVEKEKDARTREETTTTATAGFYENNVNSVEVQQAWFKCEGEQIPGGVAFGLYELEKIHGTENVVKAIFTASQANTLPRLSFNFVKAVLERQLKGGTKNASTSRSNAAAEEWEHDIEGWFNK